MWVCFHLESIAVRLGCALLKRLTFEHFPRPGLSAGLLVLIGVDYVDIDIQRLLFFFRIFYLGIYVCPCVGMCVCIVMLTESRGVGSLGAGVPGRCEVPDLGAEQRTQLLCRGSEQSEPLSHPPCPKVCVLL